MSLQLQNSVNCPDICHAIAFPPSLSKDPFVLVIIISYEDSGLPARPSCVGYARTRSCPSTTLKAVPMLGVLHHTSGEQATLPALPAGPSRPRDRPCQSPRHPPLCTWRSVGVRACHH